MFASGRHIDILKLVITVVSVSCIIGSGCVYNNYLDRDIDRKMHRTKQRPSVLGLVGVGEAIIYATCLGIIGFGLLLWRVNVTTAVIGLIGLIDYVVLYGYTKRKGTYGTLVGSISGATPPLAGYTAVTGHIGVAGLLLFLALLFWQMPHFYAIAIYRLKDYTAAKLPVLPAVRGIRTTKLYIVAYIWWYVVAVFLLYVDGYVGWPYALVLVVSGLWWFVYGLRGFLRGVDDTAWARQVFFKSLIVLLVFCAAISASSLL